MATLDGSDPTPPERRRSSATPSTDRSRLVDQDTYTMILLDPYYQLLNRHPLFRAELRILLSSYQAQSSSDGPRPPDLPVPKPLVTEFRAFAARWHLPKGIGVADLQLSLRHALRVGTAPRLLMSTRTLIRSVNIEGFSATELRDRGVEPPADGMDRWPLIVPPRLPPVRYRPTGIDEYDTPAAIRRFAREVAKQVEASILDQARFIESQARAAGYRELPPHFRTAHQRHQAALRLYRHVIDGQSWEQIADAEAGRRGRDYVPTADAARKTASALAHRLAIPLTPIGLGATGRHLGR